jgi:hypothetical protein
LAYGLIGVARTCDHPRSEVLDRNDIIAWGQKLAKLPQIQPPERSAPDRVLVEVEAIDIDARLFSDTGLQTSKSRPKAASRLPPRRPGDMTDSIGRWSR